MPGSAQGEGDQLGEGARGCGLRSYRQGSFHGAVLSALHCTAHADIAQELKQEVEAEKLQVAALQLVSTTEGLVRLACLLSGEPSLEV